eukprot:g6155.t1
MSFAEQFRKQTLPVFRHVYLRITELEQLSKEDHTFAKRDGVTSSGSSAFRRGLEAELKRICNFIDAYSEELWIRLTSILERLEHSTTMLKTSNRRTLVNHEGLELVRGQLTEIADSLIALEEFERQNILAGALLVQQHDCRVRRRLSCIQEVDAGVLREVEEAVIGDRSYDPVVLTLSTAFAGVRKLQDQVFIEESVWKPPDTFVRSTKKYWIHPADVLRVKCTVLQNLPILIFGKSTKTSSVSSRLMPLKKQGRKESAGSLVSSIYFDNEELLTYHDRLVREHGASLVRLRWYGDQSINSEDSVFVERKVHKDGWTGEESYKERAPLQGKEVLDFIQGKTVPSMTETNKNTGLLKNLQTQILSRNERPNISTQYRRVAFQESSSNRVRMSLDTNLRMIKDSKTGGSNLLSGFLDQQDTVQDQDIVQFPYAVFEIKLQTEDPPDWVTDLMSSGLLTEVPKFSKFLHGTAELFSTKIRNSPSWFLRNKQGFMESATLEQMSNPVDPFSNKAVDFLFPKQQLQSTGQDSSNSAVLRTQQQMQVSTLCHVPENHTVLSEVVVLNSGIQNTSNSHRVLHNTSVHRPQTPNKATRWRGLCLWKKPEDQQKQSSNDTADNGVVNSGAAPALVRTRIEPKTFFANERTFLSWLTVAVMVMFLGLSLLDFSSAQPGLGLFGSTSHCRQDSSTNQILKTNGTSLILEKSENEKEGVQCNVARISGALIAPMALVLMIYALVMYRKRTIQILRRETVRYDDPHGPVILTVLLVIVLFLAYIISIA